jgi:hypothetical protein
MYFLELRKDNRGSTSFPQFGIRILYLHLEYIGAISCSPDLLTLFIEPLVPTGQQSWSDLDMRSCITRSVKRTLAALLIGGSLIVLRTDPIQLNGTSFSFDEILRRIGIKETGVFPFTDE